MIKKASYTTWKYNCYSKNSYFFISFPIFLPSLCLFLSSFRFFSTLGYVGLPFSHSLTVVLHPSMIPFSRLSKTSLPPLTTSRLPSQPSQSPAVPSAEKQGPSHSTRLTEMDECFSIHTEERASKKSGETRGEPNDRESYMKAHIKWLMF